jgi:hypothetical protein
MLLCLNIFAVIFGENIGIVLLKLLLALEKCDHNIGFYEQRHEQLYDKRIEFNKITFIL